MYYYARSLSTKPPFQSAYDSLVGIFAETSKKVGMKEKLYELNELAMIERILNRTCLSSLDLFKQPKSA